MNKQRNSQSVQDQKNTVIRSLQQQIKEQEKKQGQMIYVTKWNTLVCECKTEKSHAGQVLKWKGAQAFIFTV